ncbi:MAG TPA: ribosome-associated translation inhibitor RaiA [Bryobacteraceae bacterium]|nr:ribosome-associated translation inhibitor RaiA [Bryobacteraceae bacterium]
MNVSYKGIKKELSSQQKEKLGAKFAKISKLVEKRGEKEAHVVVTSENHLHKAEITMRFYGQPLVSIASDVDLFTALTKALDKLDKQASKTCAKFREKYRRSGNGSRSEAGKSELVGVVASSENKKIAQKVFRVDHHQERKPMTIDEAVLELDKSRDYVAFRDERDRVSVLVRRRDGHFDLIES